MGIFQGVDEVAYWSALRDTPASILDELDALLARPSWHASAACRGQGPALWFPERGEDWWSAQDICQTCPVATDCARAGRDEPAGTWGGLTAGQRRRRAA